MEPLAFTAVICAAALHASWNAVVKGGLDRLLSLVLISLAASAMAAVLLPFAGVPPVDAWPWLGLSVTLHLGYKLFLLQAYRTGDLGQVYAIARGAAPVLVVAVMVTAFDEVLSPLAMAGVALLVAGIFLMSVRGGRHRNRLQGAAVVFALITSVFIASYTITDGLGARAAKSAHTYALWMFFLDGFLMLAVLAARRGKQGFIAIGPYWKQGAAGGAMMFASYWMVIWAMTVAPISVVAALRESSILFATAISVIFLREPLTMWRCIAAVSVVAGIIMARFG